MDPPALLNDTASTSATTRALRVPELLRQIIDCDELDLRSHFNCSKVSSSWREPALDVIWSHASSLNDLLRILPSVKREGDLESRRWVATGNIHADHWKRFLFYSKRTRSLKVDSVNVPSFLSWAVDISASLLSEIAFSRPPVALFPALKSLKWGEEYCDNAVWPRFSILFLNDGISNLTIRLPRKPRKVERTVTFLQEIPVRCPNISTLHILSASRVTSYGITSELVNILPLLPKLTDIRVHLHLLSLPSEIITTIAQLPNLEALDTEEFTEQPEVTGPTWVISVENAFPSLKSLKIHGVVCMVDRFIGTVSNKRNLTHLLAGLDFEDLDLQAFLQGLSKTCPALEYLTITPENNLSDETIALGTSTLSGLEISALEPIKMIRGLKELKINYFNPSEVTDDDFMKLVEALPNLSKLEFTCPQVTQGHPKLTLKVLERLSNFYRSELQSGERAKLTHLTIHVDASKWPDNSVGRYLSTTDVYPLDTMSSMQVQAGPISSERAVALYLSRLIPPGATVECDSQLPVESDHETVEARGLRFRTRKWEEALSGVALIHWSCAVDAQRNGPPRE